MILISTALLVAYLTFYILVVYPKKQYIAKMTSKMICMTLGMTSSILIGLILGIILQGHFAKSTILAIIISFVFSLLIARPFGSMATTEALCSSLMGGMMGAMLGEMLPSQDFHLMLFFIDTIYIVSMAYMLMLIKKEEFEQMKIPQKKSSPSFSLVLSIIIPVLILGIFNFIDQEQQPIQHDEVRHDHIHH
jgi:phosphoglycerol transferase MdoB-like AlkP superfamily enzyme